MAPGCSWWTARTTRRGEGTFVANTPGVAEMRRLRQRKLRDLAQAFVAETRRLGYAAEEVQQSLIEQGLKS